MAGSGFVATWKAVDISGCPAKTLTAKEAAVTSPNYPHFLLANLQCTITILAPGKLVNANTYTDETRPKLYGTRSYEYICGLFSFL